MTVPKLLCLNNGCSQTRLMVLLHESYGIEQIMFIFLHYHSKNIFKEILTFVKRNLKTQITIYITRLHCCYKIKRQKVIFTNIK